MRIVKSKEIIAGLVVLALFVFAAYLSQVYAESLKDMLVGGSVYGFLLRWRWRPVRNGFVFVFCDLAKGLTLLGSDETHQFRRFASASFCSSVISTA